MFRRWERFQGKPNKFRRDTPHVTLSPKGVILMNLIAYELAGNPKTVALLYDKQNGMIGLQPAHGDEPNTFPVKGKGNTANRVVHASPFCRHHQIKVDRTMAFNGIENEGGILILDLNTLTAVGMGGRRL
jgi:hypothetical protein